MPIALSKVQRIGLYILDGLDGPFSLEIDSIGAYRAEGDWRSSVKNADEERYAVSPLRLRQVERRTVSDYRQIKDVRTVMNRRFVRTLLIVTIALYVSCTVVPDGTEAVVEQIRQADQALLRAEEERDLEGAMAFVAPHAVFQPPGTSPIVGQEAIERFYEQQWFTLPYQEISGTPDTIVVAASGDLAYLDGRSHLVLEISGEQVKSEGKYLGVWQRIEGQWKLAAISWTANESAR